jgi:hypothetical protein
MNQQIDRPSKPNTLKEIIIFLSYSISYRVEEDKDNNYLYIWSIDHSLIELIKKNNLDYKIDFDKYVPILEDFVDFKNNSQIDIDDLNTEFDIFEKIYL